MEKEEKSEGKSFNIILVVFCFILCFIVGWFAGQYYGSLKDENENKNIETKENNNKTETTENDNNGIEQTDKNDTTETTQNDEKTYDGFYRTKENRKSGDFGILYLKSDGTFVYDESSMGCTDPTAGKYTVKGDTITFTGMVRYGCDACYNTKNGIASFTAKVDGNNLIVSESYFNKDVNSKYELNLEAEISEEFYYRYVTNPVDGKTPEANGDPWVDCTNGNN